MSILNPGEYLNNRWKIEKKIGQGTFSEIFQALDLQSSKLVAIKFEKSYIAKQMLKWENSVLLEMQGTDFVCEHIYFGETPLGHYLVMELLGESFSEYRRRLTGACGKLSLYESAKIGLEMLSAIESFHSRGFIHRDIKPSNFVKVLHPCRVHQCRLIDFGLARKHALSDGQICMPREKSEFRGTSLYASVNSHNLMDLSRRDDLWSLIFLIVDFATGALPWKVIGRENREKVKQMKEEFISNQSEQICDEIRSIIDHLSTLSYYCKPDYQYIRYLIETIISREQKANLQCKTSEKLETNQESKESNMSFSPPPPPPLPPLPESHPPNFDLSTTKRHHNLELSTSKRAKTEHHSISENKYIYQQSFQPVQYTNSLLPTPLISQINTPPPPLPNYQSQHQSIRNQPIHRPLMLPSIPPQFPQRHSY